MNLSKTHIHLRILHYHPLSNKKLSICHVIQLISTYVCDFA